MNSKSVWIYDPNTRKYLYESFGFEPQDGEWVIPTYSTESRPHLDTNGNEPDGKYNVLGEDGITWTLADLPEEIIPDVDTTTPPPIFTALEFLDLFTDTEQLAVVTATMTSPIVKLWYDRMLAAGYITSADPRTSNGLNALVSAGLLTEERKTTILESML